eukprot:scaffold297445_cov22-Prasinocladus_malaysianus.AAC.1
MRNGCKWNCGLSKGRPSARSRKLTLKNIIAHKGEGLPRNAAIHAENNRPSGQFLALDLNTQPTRPSEQHQHRFQSFNNK